MNKASRQSLKNKYSKDELIDLLTHKQETLDFKIESLKTLNKERIESGATMEIMQDTINNYRRRMDIAETNLSKMQEESHFIVFELIKRSKALEPIINELDQEEPPPF